MTGSAITIAAGRRTVPVFFTRGIGMTLAFEPGDLVLLTPEEAQRAITTGVASPAELGTDGPKKKGAKP